jgi:hypothetical protein
MELQAAEGEDGQRILGSHVRRFESNQLLESFRLSIIFTSTAVIYGLDDPRQRQTRDQNAPSANLCHVLPPKIARRLT